MGHASFNGSIFNLVNSIVGGGVLALPFACRQAGVLLGLLLVAAIAAASVASAFLLVTATQTAFGIVGNEARDDDGFVQETEEEATDVDPDRTVVATLVPRKRGSHPYPQGPPVSATTSLVNAAGNTDGTDQASEDDTAGGTVAPVRLRSYRALTTLAFGRAGALASDVSIILFLAGACVGYSVIVGEVLAPYVARVQGLEWLGANGISAILVWGVMYPLSLLKSMHSLRYTSFAAFGAICFLVVCIVVRGTEALALEADVAGRVVLFNWSPQVFSAVPIIAFAFSMHNQLMNIWAELEDPTPANIRRVMIWAVLICTVLYMVVGAFGYLSFFETTGRNILLHYDHDTLVDVAKIGYVVIVCFSFPLMMFPTALAFNSVWQDVTASCTYYLRPRPTLRRIMHVTGLTAAVFLTGMLVPDIAFVFGLSGATAGVLVMFIIPAACSLKLDAMSRSTPLSPSFISRRHTTEIFLLVAGMIFMVAGVVEVFVEQAHGADD